MKKTISAPLHHYFPRHYSFNYSVFPPSVNVIIIKVISAIKLGKDILSYESVIQEAHKTCLSSGSYSGKLAPMVSLALLTILSNPNTSHVELVLELISIEKWYSM